MQKSKISGTLGKSPKMEQHNITGLCQKRNRKRWKKNSYKQSNFILRKIWKRIRNRPKLSRRKEKINIRAELNEIESKKQTNKQKQYKRSINPRAGSLKR